MVIDVGTKTIGQLATQPQNIKRSAYDLQVYTCKTLQLCNIKIYDTSFPVLNLRHVLN